MAFVMWDKMAEDARVIKILMVAAAVLSITCILMAVALTQATQEHLIYLPPQIEEGLHYKTNQVDKPYVYSFAYTVWQSINLWENDGAKESFDKMSVYRYFISHDFRQQLEHQYRSDADALNGRTRVMYGLHQGGLLETDNVKVLSNQAWLVNLKMRVIETYQGTILKDKVVLYPLRVEKINTQKELNPYNLIITGFFADTKVVNYDP